jgi:hypothetical protein
MLPVIAACNDLLDVTEQGLSNRPSIQDFAPPPGTKASEVEPGMKEEPRLVHISTDDVIMTRKRSRNEQKEAIKEGGSEQPEPEQLKVMPNSPATAAAETAAEAAASELQEVPNSQDYEPMEAPEDEDTEVEDEEEEDEVEEVRVVEEDKDVAGQAPAKKKKRTHE